MDQSKGSADGVKLETGQGQDRDRDRGRGEVGR